MNETVRYGLWLRILHWLTALLVIGALAMVELHEFAPKGSALRNGMMYAHFQFGIIVLLIFIPHLWLRLVNKTPAIHPPVPKWQDWLSSAVHWFLLLAILVQPVMGILMMQAGGHTVNFLGWNVPAFIGKDKPAGQIFHTVHITLGNVLLYGAILHAVAAFWHQWGQRDDTMARMWFGRG